jgi:hypothetical protein
MVALTPPTRESAPSAVNKPQGLARFVVGGKRAFQSMVGSGLDFSPQPLGRHIDPRAIAGYYSDLSGKTRHPIDEMRGSEYDWVIPIAQMALGFWERRLDGEDVDADFMRAVEWLYEHATEEEIGLVWRSWLPVAKYGLEPGWPSAMGQGQAISVLLRAHLLTGEERYLRDAERALGPLRTPVAEGGVQSEIDGVPVLEEYPTARPCAVMNGWVFALWGVHELSLASERGDPRGLFERSAAGLVQLLPRYDLGWWSLYSLYDHGRPDLAKPFYQRLHPVMLEGLELITGDPALGEYARRWRAQITPRATVRVSADKLVFRARRALRSG